MKQIIFFLLLFISISASSQRIGLNDGNFEFWRFVNNNKDTIIEKYPIQGISFEYQRGKQDITIYYNTGLTQKTIWKGLWKNIYYEGQYNYSFDSFLQLFNNYTSTKVSSISILNSIFDPIYIKSGTAYQFSPSVTVNTQAVIDNQPFTITLTWTNSAYDVDYWIEERFYNTWIRVYDFPRILQGSSGTLICPNMKLAGRSFIIKRAFPNGGVSANITTSLNYTNGNPSKFIQFFERNVDLNTAGSVSQVYNVRGINYYNIHSYITSGTNDEYSVEGSFDNSNWFTLADISYTTTIVNSSIIHQPTQGVSYMRIKNSSNIGLSTPRQLSYICITGSEL